MRLLTFFFVLLTTTLFAQNTKLEYTVIDEETLMVVADTLKPEQLIRVEYFTNYEFGQLGHMDYDTMYFDMVQDSFHVRARVFEQQHWFWLHDSVKIMCCPENDVDIEPQYDPFKAVLTAPAGNLIVIYNFAQEIISESFTEPFEYEFDWINMPQGHYIIVFYNDDWFKSWQVIN